MKKLIAAALAAVIGIGLMGCADAAQTSRESVNGAEQTASAGTTDGGKKERSGKEVKDEELPELPESSDWDRGMKEFDGEKPNNFNGERPELPEDFDGDMSEFRGRGRGMRDFDSEMPEDMGERPELPEDSNGEQLQRPGRTADGSTNIEEFDKNGSKSEAAQSGSDSAAQKRDNTTAEDNSAESGSSRRNRSANSTTEESGDDATQSGTRPQLPSGNTNESGTGRQNTRPDATTGATQNAQ